MTAAAQLTKVGYPRRFPPCGKLAKVAALRQPTLAEREGFEPSKSVNPYTLSRRAPSATRPPLRYSNRGGNPSQPHPGTQVSCYRCSLPGLAELTTCCCEGTGKGHHWKRRILQRVYTQNNALGARGWIPVNWHLMVIGQLGIALLGCCGAFGWYTLKLRRANAALFEELESLREAADSQPPASEPTLEEPAETDSPAEPAAPESTAGADSAVAPTADSGAPSGDGLDSGLKTLLQQFTQDSRDMMARIDELEAQTRGLIEAARAAPDASAPATDTTPESATQTQQNSEADEPADEPAEEITDAAADTPVEDTQADAPAAQESVQEGAQEGAQDAPAEPSEQHTEAADSEPVSTDTGETDEQLPTASAG